MAGASLLTLIDDIASILDDVAVLSKVAVQKTAGVLGDDLALNAQQLTGVHANRELPVVWRVAVGSLWNKAILVPAALLISATLPWLVTPLLMIGGAYLCYEGCEKLVHKFLHGDDDHAHDGQDTQADANDAVRDPQKLHDRLAGELGENVDRVALEKGKIAGAIRTDFVLSAEIIVIALGTVKDVPFLQRVAVLVAIAVVMTVGVYGLVAGIIKLDDLGLALCRRTSSASQLIGRIILSIAPYLLKTLSIVGTAAMFIVGGGILTHGLPMVHDTLHHVSEAVHALPAVGWLLASIVTMLLDALFGILVGAVVLAIVLSGKKLFA